ncbi:MAG TPA: PRC-barrel domain-containing protein [Chloroflexota bacterium]|nr:PRC-barrel domain-containing protein [Chloroflexota bacterium]
MIDHQTFDTTANWQIADGMTVYATDGQKLGTVRNYVPQSGYIDARKGWLFTKDFYVPMSEIDTVSEEGITLKLTMDMLTDERYNAPPIPTGAVPDPVTLADGSVVDAAARKLPLEEAEAEGSHPSAALRGD